MLSILTHSSNILIGTGVTVIAAGSSVSAATVTIGHLQSLFIAMSFIALLVGPLIITKYSKLQFIAIPVINTRDEIIQ